MINFDTLTHFPREKLVDSPTPMEATRRLSERLSSRVYLKRDDLGSIGMAGNKLRKLEFLLGHAVVHGYHGVVTTGALQSNHARLTAACAAKLGLSCELVLTTSVPRNDLGYMTSGNRLLYNLFDANVTVCSDPDEAMSAMTDIVAKERNAGREMLSIPRGGSNALGSLGYVVAAHELASQLKDEAIGPVRIVLPVGSCGTAAGLIVGSQGSNWEFDLVCVAGEADEISGELRGLTREIAGLLGVAEPSFERVRIHGEFLGAGYGIPYPEVWSALEMFARTEGVVLDPVYSGKAAAWLLANIRNDVGLPVLFWHTGGAPGLFAYMSDYGPRSFQT